MYNPYYSARDQTVRFAYITILWVEGKEMQIVRKPRELRHRATKYGRWDIKFIALTVHAS
jgi:hypothetical protein